MRIIDDRDERTRNRKLKKKQYDELMTLSAKETTWARLLDEGTITYSGGEAYLYIMKGTLSNFYESLDPEYVGSVNVGHTDISSFPDRIVGEWTKKDLRLVDIGDGRQALDVRIRLYEGHPIVEALKIQSFDLGVSAEFYPHFNDEMTNNETLNPLGVPIIDGVDITDYAIVGDAGNVNSMGVELKGDVQMDISKFAALLEGEGKSIEDMNVLLSALEAEEVEETPGTVEGIADETAKTTEVVTEEATEEEAEDTTEVAEEAAEAGEEAAENAEEAPSMSEVLQALMSEIQSLRNENAELKEKYSAKEAQWAEFTQKMKKLTVVKTDTKKPEIKSNVQYTDGIGE